MPFSNPVHRNTIQKFLMERWPRGKRIVDVGTGAGAYADLLGGHFLMIGVEVFERYFYDYKLGLKYKMMIQADVRNLGAMTFLGAVVIMGDVLEHLTVPEAQQVIETIKRSCDGLLIAVPFLYEQGPEHPDTIKFGNIHEVHHQPDLTHELFMERYPGFQEIARNEQIGVYYWSPK